MSNRTQLGALALAALFASACTANSESTTVGAATAVTVTTDAPTYQSDDTIVVTYDGLPGDPTDWIGIYPVGSNDFNFVAWTYTDGSAAGAVNITANFAPGTYVARAFPQDSFAGLGESTRFTVALTGINVSTDLQNYGESQDIVVSYSGFTEDAADWITIVPVNTPASAYDEWHYTDGTPSGQITFSPHAAGSYEVRAYFHDNFNLVTSTTFTVTGPPAVSSEQPAYNLGDDVTIVYENLPGNSLDWVAVAPKGSPNSVFSAWSYTDGAASGAATFSNLPAGVYVTRAFENDTFTLVAEGGSFTVGAAGTSVSTSQSSYTPSDTITVNYAAFTDDPADWITIVPANAPNGTLGEWHYTDGTSTGSLEFAALPSGDYEVRGYFADNFNLVTTATFSVSDL